MCTKKKKICSCQTLVVNVMDKIGVFLVGLGGTGGLLAPKLAKILLGIRELDLWLVDGDVVDKGNVARQPYQEFNIDEKKASALSRKLKSCYDLNIYEYSEYLTGREISKISYGECYDLVIILGCVDNHATRVILEKEHKKIKNSLYIDSANGFDNGSVFITLSEKVQHTKKRKLKKSSIIRGSLRSELFPDVLTTKDHPVGLCGEEIAKGNTQQLVTNDIMANSIAMVINDFLATSDKKEFKTGVIRVDRFERLFVAD